MKSNTWIVWSSDEGEKHRDFYNQDKSHSVAMQGDGSLHVKQFISSSITEMKKQWIGAWDSFIQFALIDFVSEKICNFIS